MRRIFFLFLALLVAACGGTPAPRLRFAGPSINKRSTAEEREAVSITVYNQNFGLVREVRNVDLGRGRIALEFRDVSSQIQPATVHIKSLGASDSLTILEQNYRYDLLSPHKLLEKYVDKKVKVIRWNEKLGKDEEFEADVLSAQGGDAVLKMGNEITYGFPGRISFPEVPANLIAKPTLVWLLESTAPKQKLEVTYLTKNLNWQADYVFVIDDSDAMGDLTGWVTLTNQTGSSYENARLKLVAGDVQRVADAEREETKSENYGYLKKTLAQKAFTEEGFFEYHLYTLDKPTSLLEKETKQVTLLEAEGIKLDKHLLFYGASHYYRGQQGQVVSNQKVSVVLDIENTEKNRLGMPLPKGIVRVYKADKGGAKQFIGEDRIDHTPRDEKLRIKMGEAFDVVGDRRQTDFKQLGKCVIESAWEITLRNHKDLPQAVEVIEPVEGDWAIVSSSLPFDKKDAHTFLFRPTVKARGEIKLTYRVRVKWC